MTMLPGESKAFDPVGAAVGRALGIKPPSVTVGPVKVTAPTPGSLKPPDVQVKGKGEIAKAVNGANQVAQAPGKAADKAIEATGKGVSHFFGEVGKFVKDPFGAKKWANEKLEQTRAWLESILKQAVGWFLLGLLGIVVLAVAVSSAITGLFVRRALVQAKAA